jgi:hypothetical protein
MGLKSNLLAIDSMNGSTQRILQLFSEFGRLYSENARIMVADPDRPIIWAAYDAGLQQSMDGFSMLLTNTLESLPNSQTADFERLMGLSGAIPMLESSTTALRSTLSDPEALIDLARIFDKIKRIFREIFPCLGIGGIQFEPALGAMDRFKENINSLLPGEGLAADCAIDYSLVTAQLNQDVTGTAIFLFSRVSSESPEGRVRGAFNNGRFTPVRQRLLSEVVIGRGGLPLFVGLNANVTIRVGGRTFAGAGLGSKLPRPMCGAAGSFPLPVIVEGLGTVDMTIGFKSSRVKAAPLGK